MIEPSQSTSLILPDSLREEMLAHIIRCLPEEACGLLGGRREEPAALFTDAAPYTAVAVLPVVNELHSPVRFRMDPADQLKAFYWLEEHDQELAAIFHSHPQGPEHPSATDLAEFAYPGVLMLIVSPIPAASTPAGPAPSLSTPSAADLPRASRWHATKWQIRAFRIDGGLPPRLTASELRLLRPGESDDPHGSDDPNGPDGPQGSQDPHGSTDPQPPER